MSSTTYQIFCRYYHSSAGKVVTNESKVVWKQAEESHGHTDGKQIAPSTSTKSVSGQENMIIRHEDYLRVNIGDDNVQSGSKGSKEYYQKVTQAKSIDTALSNIIVDEAVSSNPKYDMIFLYDGLVTCEGAPAVNTSKYIYKPGQTQTNEASPLQVNPPIVYYEKMKRFEGPAPWFLYATASSLTAIMKKAEELVNIMGKNNVIIGKVVDIEEYIDIV